MRLALRCLGSLISIVLFAAIASAWDYKSAWECDNTNKFFWYCHEYETPMTPLPPVEKEPNLSPGEAAMKELERIQQDLKEKRAIAILEPSPDNIKAYIDAQERLMDRASVFSDTWRRVLWQTPDLDYRLRSPVNNAAVDVYRNVRLDAIDTTIREIAKDWGLFFFFRSDCPYCHKMAPVLLDIANQYSVTVFPISLDGNGIPGFPNPHVDRTGLIASLGISHVPAIVLGNVRDRQMIPLGTGMIAKQDILERIYLLTKTKPGESF